MPTLLHLDSSPLESSISRELTREFVKTWQDAHPTGTVIYRDLAANPPKPVDTTWIYSSYTLAASRTAEQKAALAPSEELIAELERADESVLKLWVDQIVRNGRTFVANQSGRQGLLQGKRATILAASGGVYEAGTPAGALNFVDPYLKTILGFIGVTDVKFVTAGGVAQVMTGAVDRATFLKPALETVRTVAA